jgi:cytochrome b561
VGLASAGILVIFWAFGAGPAPSYTVSKGPDGTLSGVGSGALNVHSLLANLMWALPFGHAVVAVWHQIKWHDVLKCVFSTKQSVGSIDEERERMP